MFLGFGEYIIILVGIALILILLICALGSWLITEGGKEKKE